MNRSLPLFLVVTEDEQKEFGLACISISGIKLQIGGWPEMLIPLAVLMSCNM